MVPKIANKNFFNTKNLFILVLTAYTLKGINTTRTIYNYRTQAQLINDIGYCRMLSQRIHKKILLNKDFTIINTSLKQLAIKLDLLENTYPLYYREIKPQYEEYQNLIVKNNYTNNSDIEKKSDKFLIKIDNIVNNIESRSVKDLYFNCLLILISNILTVILICSMFFSNVESYDSK
jgi:nitrate/nitrite-specific signal transduction histidine kinase